MSTTLLGQWAPEGTNSRPELVWIFIDEFAVTHFIVCILTLDIYKRYCNNLIEREGVPNFQLFWGQSLELDNEQLDEIEHKAQAKTNKRATEWESSEKVGEMGKKKISVDLKTVSATELRENMWKFFAEVKTGKASSCKHWLQV